MSLILSDMSVYGRRLKELHPLKKDPPYPEYAELLAKRLPWFIKHLCERTDMVECGVSLRVATTNDIRDMVMPYLEACRFPMDAINWIENRDVQYKWAAKYGHLNLSFAKRVLHFDLSFLIGTHPAQRQIPLFAKILERWGDERIASAISQLFYYRGESVAVREPRVEEKSRDAIAHRQPIYHPIWRAISAIYDQPVGQLFNYWTEVNPFHHMIVLNRINLIGF